MTAISINAPLHSQGYRPRHFNVDRAVCWLYTHSVVATDDYFNLPGVAVVKWDARSKAAHMEWQGWARPTEFRAANDALLRALREHRSSRVLGDSRKIKVIQQTDQDWVNRDWFPRILAAGLRRMALVLPESGLAKMNIDDLISQVPGTKLVTAYFTTLDQARDWLTQPQAVETTVLR